MRRGNIGGSNESCIGIGASDMSTPKFLVVILSVVVLGQLAFAQTVTDQQQRFVSGVIENLDGERLANTTARLTNLGSVATSETGEFALLLPPHLQPGDPMEISMGEEWVVVKPFEGQGFIPPSFTEVIHVRVARRGDPRLLTDPKLVKQLVVSVTSILGSEPGHSADRDQLLAEKVREMGFSVDQLKSAIDAWGKSVQRPYEKGLAALYARAYADASAYIRQSTQVSDDDQVEKYLCLASAEYQLARYSEAVVALQAARRIQPNNPRVLNQLGVALAAQGQYQQAQETSQLSLAIYERALGSDHPEIARQLNNIAVDYDEQGMYAEAEPLYKRAISIAEKIPGADGLLATALNGLGAHHTHQGKYLEATTLYERALEIHQRVLGMEHPDVAIDLNNLAATFIDLGRYAEAGPLYRRALAIKEKNLGPEHPSVALALSNLGNLYSTQGRYSDAERLHKRALLIAEKALGPTHEVVATYLYNLGADYYQQERYSEAEPLYKRALEIKEKVLGPEHPDVANCLSNLAMLYEHGERYAEAEPLYRRALAIDQKVLGAEHPSLAVVLHNLAVLYIDEGKQAEALPLLEESLAINERAFGPDHPHVAADLTDLATALRGLGRVAEADTDEERAATIRKKISDKSPKQ